MVEFFNNLEAWHWLTLAVILIALELGLIGAYFLLASGVAAIVMAALLAFDLGLSWQVQLALWGLLSVSFIVGWSIIRHSFPRAHAPHNDEPKLNDRSQQYVGRQFVLDMDVQSGIDVQHRLDDTYWTVRADSDYSAGSRVKIVRAASTVLFVEAV